MEYAGAVWDHHQVLHIYMVEAVQCKAAHFVTIQCNWIDGLSGMENPPGVQVCESPLCFIKPLISRLPVLFAPILSQHKDSIQPYLPLYSTPH